MWLAVSNSTVFFQLFLHPHCLLLTAFTELVVDNESLQLRSARIGETFGAELGKCHRVHAAADGDACGELVRQLWSCQLGGGSVFLTEGEWRISGDRPYGKEALFELCLSDPKRGCGSRPEHYRNAAKSICS